MTIIQILPTHFGKTITNIIMLMDFNLRLHMVIQNMERKITIMVDMIRYIIRAADQIQNQYLKSSLSQLTFMYYIKRILPNTR